MSWKKKYERNWGRLGMKYKTYTMEDALEAIIDYRGKTPKKSEKGIPTLSAKSVKNNHIDYDSCYYISSDEYKRFMVRGLPQIGDVLLTTEAPLGMVAQLDRNDVGIAQRLLTLRGKQGILDNEYLLYYLQSPIGQALLRARETGTTVTGIKQSEFRKIQIDIPDIENQRKIGGILRGLDDKIAVNNSINKNLEQQIEAILLSFIENTTSNTVKLGDYLYIKGRIGWKGLKKEEYLEHSDYRIINGESLTKAGIDWSKAGYISQARYDESPEIMLQNGDILLSKDGTIGKIGYIDSLSAPTTVASGIFVIRNLQPNIISTTFIYYLLKSQLFTAFIVARTEGSVIPHLYQKDFLQFEFPLPDKKEMENFEGLTAPMFSLIVSNLNENVRLAHVRDNLLTRLMSGEIDISAVDL